MHRFNPLKKPALLSFIVVVALVTATCGAFAAKKQGTSDRAVASERGGGAVSGDPQESEQDRIAEATKSLHTTGQPQDVDIATWRLTITGEKVGNPLSLTYDQLTGMQTVKGNPVLVCPGFFRDIADWEGVPVPALLDMAQVSDDYRKIDFVSVDGYRSSLTKKEIEDHLVFLAFRVNGVTLPREHGFPIRLVAEDVTGGKWVKWITELEVH
jgi:DMSO/TMAO reductase YedYZ molybdopterin-dependent catalytic subunit